MQFEDTLLEEIIDEIFEGIDRGEPVGGGGVGSGRCTDLGVADGELPGARMVSGRQDRRLDTPGGFLLLPMKTARTMGRTTRAQGADLLEKRYAPLFRRCAVLKVEVSLCGGVCGTRRARNQIVGPRSTDRERVRSSRVRRIANQTV